MIFTCLRRVKWNDGNSNEENWNGKAFGGNAIFLSFKENIVRLSRKIRVQCELTYLLSTIC
jgi:hypothetical protein